MTEKEVRDIVRELILEIEENELAWYGVRWNNGFNTYKVKAKNPRHASEKIEALHGVKIDFHNFQKLPDINSKKQLKIRSIEKEKQDKIDAIAKEKRDRDEKIRKDLEEKSDYIAYFKFPLSVALESFLQLDIRKALNEKYFRITPVPENPYLPSHVGGVPVKLFLYNIQIPKMYFIPEVLEKLLNPRMKEKLRKEARDRVRMICDNAEWVLIDFEELNPKTINVYFQNYKELKGGPLRLREVKDDFDTTPDPENVNPFDSDIDDDKGLSAFDIRPGSDLSPGDKVGGTIMPHGFGFPNWTNKGRRMTKKDLDSILHIGYIEGVSEDDEFKHSKVDQKATYNFIQQHFPYIFNYGHTGEGWPKQMWYPFADYFGNEGSFLDWRRDFASQVEQQLSFFIHWRDFDTKQLKNAAKYNRHWISRYKQAQQDSKQYPNLEKDLRSILEFLNKLYSHSPTNPKNSTNYPAFVSLYDTTRRLGGGEEGGWWYDQDDLVHSIPVRNYQEVRKASVILLRFIGEADLNGKPLITLEKESGGRGNKPPPSYS